MIASFLHWTYQRQVDRARVLDSLQMSRAAVLGQAEARSHTESPGPSSWRMKLPAPLPVVSWGLSC